MSIEMDSVFKEVGECGRYQIIVATLLIFAGSFPAVFIAYNQVFLSATPDHWCLVPELVEINLPLELRKNLSIPLEMKNGVLKHSHCEMYSINYSSIRAMHSNRVLDATDRRAAEGQLENRKQDMLSRQGCIYGWEYDRSDYDETLVTQFDLVCDQNWRPSFCTSTFYAGGLLGIMFYGWISDKYGRKLAFLINLSLVIVLPMVSALSTDYTIFTVFRFFIGVQFPAIFQIPFIIVLELTSSKYRTAMGMILALVFGVAICVLSGIAFLSRHWFTLTLVTTVPFSLMFFYFWIIPESPRWLISQHRLDEAEDILQKMAKINNRHISRQIIHKYQTRDDVNVVCKSISPMILFRTPNLCKKTSLIMFIFVTNAMCYTGLNYMSANLGVSDYLAFGLSGLVEAPSCLLSWYAMEKWGRRWTTFFTMLFVGLCCVGNVFVPEETLWLNVTLPALGKFWITASFSIVYVYGGELLPTVVRGNGLALCSFVCGLGNIAVPYVVYLVVYSRVTPLLIMGLMSVVGGIGAVFLPETLNTDLPTTLDEGEEFGKHMKYFHWTSMDKNISTSSKRNVTTA